MSPKKKISLTHPFPPLSWFPPPNRSFRLHNFFSNSPILIFNFNFLNTRPRASFPSFSGFPFSASFLRFSFPSCFLLGRFTFFRSLPLPSSFLFRSFRFGLGFCFSLQSTWTRLTFTRYGFRLGIR